MKTYEITLHGPDRRPLTLEAQSHFFDPPTILVVLDETGNWHYFPTENIWRVLVDGEGLKAAQEKSDGQA
jgi:hypothetical protein